MRFIWFWTFWHWSKESFRSGALLRGPLQGIGSHWDEWFRHEASAEDRQLIETAGADEPSQRAFIVWLMRQWTPEIDWSGNRQITRFVLSQLAPLPPFNSWPAFSKYQKTYGATGVNAVVLAEESRGEGTDVRAMEALLLPADRIAAGPPIVTEGFQADAADLSQPREAVLSLLSGTGLGVFLARWIAYGQRPYPRWMSVTIWAGWGLLSAGIVSLLVGPEPGDRLAFWFAALLLLWTSLVMTSFVIVSTQVVRAWRQGRQWALRLKQGQVWLRMNGGLTFKGGSAGLAYCLNILLALYRAYPRVAQRSWLWSYFFRELAAGAPKWAATGSVTPDASLKAVALEEKLRACLQRSDIAHFLTPHQRQAKVSSFERSAAPSPSPVRSSSVGQKLPRFGFAAEAKPLRIHRCGHIAQALMGVGGLSHSSQLVLNIFALLVSGVMLAGLPDMWSIVRPPAAPAVVTPGSPSPYYLWVSLDTKSPDYFQAILESHFWTNRRVDVSEHKGALGSIRAEIRLLRASMPTTTNVEDGTIWIERRRRFLSRDYDPGERVGRYSFSYLAHLPNE